MSRQGWPTLTALAIRWFLCTVKLYNECVECVLYMSSLYGQQSGRLLVLSSG